MALDIQLCWSLRESALPLVEGEASVTLTCPVCRGIGAVLSYVEVSTGAGIEMPCPGCDEMGIVEGVTLCYGEADHTQDENDMADFAIMTGTY